MSRLSFWAALAVAAPALVLAIAFVVMLPHPDGSLAEAIAQPTSPTCTQVENGSGPTGTVPVRMETVVSGLEVPWGIAFLPSGDWLVTERPGRVRLVRAGTLLPQPVMTVETAESGEGGLLGIALHPDFASNSLFYVYYTTNKPSGPVNRIERFRYDTATSTAVSDRIIYDDIPSGTFHNGGRIHFGPDGMLYAGTGDSRTPELAQNSNSPAGKILRLTPDGTIPSDNPFPGSPAFIIGVRNVEAFDWVDPSLMVIADNGPTGELGRTGEDEVDLARAGNNLGWPTDFLCEQSPGTVAPSLTWKDAVPPGGGAVYRGTRVPEFQGNFLFGSLGAEHLHRVVFANDGSGRTQSHEVYFQSQYGRLREVVNGPDGELYVTTSNCDSRGECPTEKDQILRLSK